MTLLSAAAAIRAAESARKHHVEDLRGHEAIEYAAQHPGTPVLVCSGQWFAYDGLGGVAQGESWEDVAKTVRDRNGEQAE